MRNRQGKCPGCGLANFRDAAECRWCALALSGRARNEYTDDAPAGPGRPWGLLLMLFALLAVGGGLVWHVQRKAAARAESAAEQAEAADDSAELPRRTGPPALSGRSPSDPPRDLVGLQPVSVSPEEAEKRAERVRQWRGQIYDSPSRDIRGSRDPRASESTPRHGEEAPSPPASDDPE